MTAEEKLWTKREVAEHLALNIRTVERMAIPRVTLPGAGARPIVRYDPVQVRAWWDKYRTRKVVSARL
jgi:hypothetical protein